MKLNFHWPRTKKRYYWNPWYVILWKLLICPLLIVSAAAFYVSAAIFWRDLYTSEQFRKEYFR